MGYMHSSYIPEKLVGEVHCSASPYFSPCCIMQQLDIHTVSWQLKVTHH